MDINSTGLITLEGFKLLVEESLTGIYLIQHERLVYCQPRLAEIFGYSRRGDVGASVGARGDRA